MLIYIVVIVAILIVLSPFIWYVFWIIKTYAEMKVFNYFFKLNIDKYDEEKEE